MQWAYKIHYYKNQNLTQKISTFETFKRVLKLRKFCQIMDNHLVFLKPEWDEWLIMSHSHSNLVKTWTPIQLFFVTVLIFQFEILYSSSHWPKLRQNSHFLN